MKRLNIIYKMEHNLINIPLDHYIQHNARSSRKQDSQFLQMRHSANIFGNTVTTHKTPTVHCHHSQNTNSPLSPLTKHQQSTVTTHKTPTVHCHHSQNTNSPLSPLTKHQQSTVTSCMTLTVHCHYSQNTNSPLSPVA